MNFKKPVTKKILLATIVLSLGSCLTYAKNINDIMPPQLYTDNIVHFADEQNRLITLDYNTMELLDTRALEGSLNHHADPLGTLEQANYMMMVPKGSNFVTVREIKSGEHIKKIRLPFKPRSADAYNPLYDLVLLNSRNRPAAVLIDATELKIVGQAGFNITCNLMSKDNIRNRVYASYDNFDPNFTCSPMDFGGDQISGHPIWIDSEHFVIIDRSNRLLHVYNIFPRQDIEGHIKWETKLVQAIPTDSSLHQLIPEDAENPDNTVFYGMTEGNQAQTIIPRIYKFKFDGKKLEKIKSSQMTIAGNGVSPTTIIGTLGHNLYISPDKKYLYAPLGGTRTEADWKSIINEKGAVFIVDTDTMKVVKQIPAGKGAGHVAFSKQNNLAVVTNHMDNFVTVIDTNKQVFVKNILLDYRPENIFNLTQSHMQHISKDGKYYYNFWTDGGVFFRINLSTLEVDSSVYTGGIPIQGNFYKHIALDNMVPRPAIEDGFDDFFPTYTDTNIDTKPEPLLEEASDSNAYNK